MHKLALLVLLVGCSKSDSGDILTSGMYGSINARASGTGTTLVSTSLFLGNPINLNFIELSDGDRLVVRHGGQEVVPTEGELLNVVSYTASFPTDAEGEEFEVAFERDVDAGAPSSVATLPAPYTLAPPPASSSRAAALTLTWSPSGTGDAMTLVVEGSCIDTANVPVAGDPGTVTIAAATLRKKMAAMGQTIDDSCQATVKVERKREGVIDAHFGKGGHATGIQARSATFTTAP
jgi:hypothetical protein